jgi:hypothetical protein
VILTPLHDNGKLCEGGSTVFVFVTASGVQLVVGIKWQWRDKGKSGRERVSTGM